MKEETSQFYSSATRVCTASQKIRFETEAAAVGGAIARVNRGNDARPLSVYLCAECGGWHHTSSVGGRNSTVIQKRQKAVAQERVDRALALVIDAEAVALTALYEYPKGNPMRVLEVVRAAYDAANVVRVALSRDELESPELDAAHELLRPKMKALELLARAEEP